MSLRIAIPEADWSTRGTLDPQPDLLDAFVAEYERELANDMPEMPDFFYTFVPSRMLRDDTNHFRIQDHSPIRLALAISGD